MYDMSIYGENMWKYMEICKYIYIYIWKGYREYLVCVMYVEYIYIYKY